MSKVVTHDTLQHLATGRKEREAGRMIGDVFHSRYVLTTVDDGG